MNILCIGGGPAGLYFALLMKKQRPDATITVVERNQPYDTFGWGVVFSDQTLGNLEQADAKTAAQILAAFNHWDDIAVHFKGQLVSSGGHGFCGIGRQRLLNILQHRCEELGVQLVFNQDVEDEQALALQYQPDLIIAADGLNSRLRSKYADVFRPDIDTRRCRFVWLGTKQRFPAFTFAFEETEFGWFQAHAYQYDGETSTFIVETPEEVWLRAGLDQMSQEQAIQFCEKLFARYLDGHALMSNARHLRGSANWIKFPRILCQRWVHHLQIAQKRVPLVLMGDAAHTAHFSIGSGTKLALEDAIELAQSFAAQDNADLESVLTQYESKRSVEVLKIQSAARNSMEWFESVSRYSQLQVPQFAYSMLTRSQRLSHENLRLRDPAYIAGLEQDLAQQAFAAAGLPLPQTERPVPPMLTPFRLRELVLPNRIVVSPMAQYSAQDGVVGDYHLVHLGSRAMGGAGLVMAEMTCVSADARITPACPGLYEDAHIAAWQRVVDFVHTRSSAKIGVQLGHAGAKGATRVAWEGIDQPLTEGGWPLISASEQQYLPGVSALATAATAAQLQQVLNDFVSATRRADAAGFDWLELHCAHGYFLSSFISPLTNQRSDQYGDSLENRCRYPLEVFAAMRAVWPEAKPLSVRISAHDWVQGGITPDDAVQIARLFKAAGADLIDCSSGQVSKAEKPVFGRMYQTPFADRIRNEAGIATMAVGAITEADHANSIIAAGRADLCAIGRPHLTDPAWTLHEAAKMGFRDITWPRQYLAGKAQLERNLQRERAAEAPEARIV
ncbi:bifunctional salicylyl-CoA 5-hydroxylase/oxidoreductase [Undibacterium sp. CY7W]|uniref:Bifunctional salicylyl-CoA 5-hydroxylase/oxidoreductase n=1 Tax=Undibacterium rugosum TaxID=2762291 RepID=A0A923I0F2_9BURK|nr:bifunctional salicylyl-CoA 5-hydroxylase/oxidoreductase [Undibacterium rugosum]MBC3935528.1 bifunctional salicylyl-CoA 5-hydroxylase/oxidoreductase [Undibacterium rugosum]